MSLLKNNFNNNKKLNNNTIDIIIFILVFGVFILSLIIIINKAPVSPIFHIENISFYLNETSRNIELDIVNERGKLDIKKIIINNNEVNNLKIKRESTLDKEKFNCKINYHWKMNELYVIDVIANSGLVSNKTVSPSIEPEIDIRINNVSTNIQNDFINFNVNYSLSSVGSDLIKTILFSYNYYNNCNREIYLFYDKLFMSDVSISKADSIILYFNKYNINVNKIDYKKLEELSKLRPKIILIFINPLKNENNNTIDNALISPIIDSDEDGFAKDNSLYNKSILYDWMMDDGLIFVSLGSVKSYSNVISKNQELYILKDINNSLNLNLFLPLSSVEKNIINNNFQLTEYSPSRISQTLGLSRRIEQYGYDKNVIEKNGINYYAYGDYILYMNEVTFNLTLPVFIPIGEGGWLDIGDENHDMDKDQLAHEIFMLYLQSIWDSDWIPYGWYWDSGSSIYRSTGKLSLNGNLYSENIPSNILNKKISFKIIAFAYNKDLDKIVVTNQILKDFIINK